jgi:hypothetical protein
MKYLRIALFSLAATTLYGLDEAVVQYYIPSLFGITSGEGAIFHQLKPQVKSRFLIPIEAKIPLYSLFDVLGLSGLGMLTTYLEDGTIGSFNISLGAGFHLDFDPTKPSFMQGMYISLYPLYELPLIPIQGGTPLVYWKGAFDLGIAFDLFSTPFCASIYMRTILFWLDSYFGAIPDFGMTIGWHFLERRGREGRPFIVPAGRARRAR